MALRDRQIDGSEQVEQDRQIVAEDVGGDEIERAVAVEIAERD